MMELSDPITLRLLAEVLADIEKVAASCSRTRSWVMVRALRFYLANEGASVLSILAGRAEAAAGGGHDIDDVLAEMDAIINADDDE